MKAEGKALDDQGEHWTVLCPKCEKEFEYKGWFDSSDKTECKCGCTFTTSKVWIDDKNYLT